MTCDRTSMPTNSSSGWTVRAGRGVGAGSAESANAQMDMHCYYKTKKCPCCSMADTWKNAVKMPAEEWYKLYVRPYKGNSNLAMLFRVTVPRLYLSSCPRVAHDSVGVNSRWRFDCSGSTRAPAHSSRNPLMAHVPEVCSRCGLAGQLPPLPALSVRPTVPAG